MALLPGCASLAAANPPAAPAEVATGELRLADGRSAGRVALTRGPHGLLLRIEGENWPQGWHGVHLHAVGNCAAPAFTSAAGHVNHAGATRQHGLMNPEGPDLGDLQNVWAHADGTARAEVFMPTAGRPAPGAFLDADGLALVVHANADDHLTQPIGGAGDRIACAVLAPARD